MSSPMHVELIVPRTKRSQVNVHPLAPHRTVSLPANVYSNEQVPDLLDQFYGVLDELQTSFRRRFTPEGGLDLSLGEALAELP
jgi:hypothetical protein